MIKIKPLRGLRPRDDIAARVAAPPYDVISSEEAREMARGNPVSFLHVNKPEIDLPPETDLYSEPVYAKGAENLRRFMAEGILQQDQSPSIYVYRQEWRGRVQTGYLCLASVEDYDSNRIRKHELTRASKEKDRTTLMDRQNAQIGPVFLMYQAEPELDGLLAAAAAGVPLVDFTTSDQVRHTLWRIEDPGRISAIISGFAHLEKLYVADGHHRSAAASNLCRERRAANPHHTGEEPYNYFLAVIFPHNHLRILPYNRVVTDLNGLSVAEFLQKAGETFLIEPAGSTPPEVSEHTIGMYLDGRWYLLTPRPGIWNPADALENLDVNILMNNILGPLLAIGDPRTDQRIDFIGGIRGPEELVRLVDSGKFRVAFLMHPTSIEQLIAVADAGLIMPPKSTWFEPKLRSGLVIHLLD
ncbi:MAG TPA: DUF1015 family protein [bacterium]|nr:DUF1015 family protein [bacterium]HQJ64912.1 DUF1015 family protein [bacterium]